MKREKKVVNFGCWLMQLNADVGGVQFSVLKGSRSTHFSSTLLSQLSNNNNNNKVLQLRARKQKLPT